MTVVKILPTQVADLNSLKSLLDIVWNEEDAVIHHNAGRSAGIKAEIDGEIVGYGCLFERELHPKFRRIGIHVHPEYRQQGIGTALWQEVTRGFSGPLKTATYHHFPEAVRFLKSRGMVVVMETHMPTLDLTNINLETIENWKDIAEEQGFEFKSMSMLDGSDVGRRLARLHLDVYAHTHEHDVPVEESEEEAEADFLGDDLRPAWLWIAERNGIFAGVSSVRDMGDASTADLGWFGVTKDFADYGRTLTLALTGLALQSAAADGVKQISSELDSADPNAMHLLGELPWQPGNVWIALTGES